MFGGIIAAILFSRVARAAKRGVMTRDAYFRQRPLLITGVCAYAVIFAASVARVPETILYWMVAGCLVVTITVWMWIRRKQHHPPAVAQRAAPD